MKKEKVYLIIGSLIILLLYTFGKITRLENNIENLTHTLNTLESQLYNEVNTIYQNVDQKLEKQASLIYNASVKVGELDQEALTIPLTFTVEPKVVTETTQVFLDFEGEIVELDRAGLQYSCTQSFAIVDAIFPKVIIADQGIKNIEENRALMVRDLTEQVFPHVFGRFSGESSYSVNSYREKGTVSIDYKPALQSNPIIDINYVVKVDDEIIQETPVGIAKDSELGGSLKLNIDEKYPIKHGQTLTSNIVAKDRMGFTYNYLVTHFVAGSRAQREPRFEQLSIIAPNGAIIYPAEEK